MYEEKKTKTTKSYAIKLFQGIPWMVKAFLNLFLIMLVAIIIFAFLGHFSEIQVFNNVAEELTSFLKVVVGAIIGALSAEAKEYVKRKDA